MKSVRRSSLYDSGCFDVCGGWSVCRSVSSSVSLFVGRSRQSLGALGQSVSQLAGTSNHTGGSSPLRSVVLWAVIPTTLVGCRA